MGIAELVLVQLQARVCEVMPSLWVMVEIGAVCRFGVVELYEVGWTERYLAVNVMDLLSR